MAYLINFIFLLLPFSCFSLPEKVCLQTEMQAVYLGNDKNPIYYTKENQTLYGQQTYYLIFKNLVKNTDEMFDFLVYGHGFNKAGDIAPINGTGYIDKGKIHIAFSAPLIQYSTGNYSPSAPADVGLYATYIVNSVMEFDLKFNNGKWNQFNIITNSNLVTPYSNNYNNDYIVGFARKCSP